MSHGGPYRPLVSSSWLEEELWARLDEALLEALDDPAWAHTMTVWIIMDSADFPDVRRAAEKMLELWGQHDERLFNR